MASKSLNRFKRRLALVDYFRHIFGVKDIHDPDSVREFYNMLSEQREGYDAEGRSYVYNVLKGRIRTINPANLLRYDANVKHHTDTLNQNRPEPIKLKYFQILPALMTEVYLDRVTEEPDAFLSELNAFVNEQNEKREGQIKYPTFEREDLNKLAFWMATGSGKTLLMHLNYYQYLHYQPDVAENILLVTPNEGLSRQHISEMEKSGILCQRFTATTSDLFNTNPWTVKVIEITKLVEEKTGGGESLEVSSFEGRNLVLVDEGHKGTGSEAQAWRSRRAALAEHGFTFEYSATFGQAVGTSSNVQIEEEYGKAIIFDYSYPRFYEDGYGKDYRILNLEHDFDPELTNLYLLADLLAFYEQSHSYASNTETFYATYNVAPPLLVFIGHSVTAGKTRSQLSPNDKRSLSDVQELVLFLHRVLANENNWVPQAIDSILSGEAGLKREDGSDLFTNAFRTLRKENLGGAAIYRDMLQRLFHVDMRGGNRLHLSNLKEAEGEIGLRVSSSDKFFGVINIGDDSNFLKLVEEKTDALVIEEHQFSGSLFQEINQRESPINLLIGAKKFIEGWDSWRVSTMGLMNIGRGEGPQIIQLFGRGVRLLGKDRSLKRSTTLDGHHPDELPILETLNIFGVRAKYMAQFRDYLSEEGIDTEEEEIVVLPTVTNEDFLGKGLLVVRPKTRKAFEDEVRLRLKLDEECMPDIDLMPRMDVLTSREESHVDSGSQEEQVPRYLPNDILDFLNSHELYKGIWQFREARGYYNLMIDIKTLRSILAERHYQLYCPAELVKPQSFRDLQTIEELALMILRKYVERYYTRAQRQWEHRQLAYQPLDADDGNLIRRYEAKVKRSSTELIEALHKMTENPGLIEAETGLPPRVFFDRHLYLPLLLQRKRDEREVKYSPPGLNDGEFRFVKKLRDYCLNGGQEVLGNRELFLLRNQSRGHGIGFLVDGERYFPDFILWLKSGNKQDVAFIDPKGLRMAGDPKVNSKVNFRDGIKQLERDLNQQASRSDIALHSFIVSDTSFQEMKKLSSLTSLQEFNRLHIYFPEQANYIDLLIESIS